MTEFCDLSKECHVFYFELLKYCIALYLIHMKLNLRGTLDWMNTNLKLEIWSEISKGICNKKKRLIVIFQNNELETFDLSLI